MFLAYNSSRSIDCNHGKAHLQHPCVHDVMDSFRKIAGANFVNSLQRQKLVSSLFYCINIQYILLETVFLGGSGGVYHEIFGI